jgi:hypothetical protein
MHVAPQVLAARCRHQPDNQARAAFWVDLDARFRDFQAKFPNRTSDDFTSCERRSTSASRGRDGYKPSTVKTWLREWQASAADRDCDLSKEMT